MNIPERGTPDPKTARTIALIEAENTHRKGEMESVILTPTDEGYTNMAVAFGQSVLGDVRKPRQKDSANLLVSLIEIAAYLGSKKDIGLLNELKARVGTYLPR